MIEVLDHGFVRLVDHMGSDLSISRAARVSYDAPGRPEDANLIHYLWKHKHTTPFEAVVFTFEVMAPIFVLRQWHRHRTMSYSELSARYRSLPENFYVPEADKIGVQATDNKQARNLETNPKAKEIRDLMRESNSQAFSAYTRLLAKGTPRELARSVLPVATYSHMFATVNLLNLLKFCTLRSHPHAQFEIRAYSDALLELIEPIVPIALEAYHATDQ